MYVCFDHNPRYNAESLSDKYNKNPFHKTQERITTCFLSSSLAVRNRSHSALLVVNKPY